MPFNPNSNKHKANHGGYKGRPTKQQVKALLNLYAGCQVSPKAPIQNVKVDSNGQYKMIF
jgi:hypothetical protein